MKQTARCCPWSSTGASLDITGCRFLVSPMSDDYINIILGAIEKTNTSKIWSKTDKTSTVYRGKRVHVMDCAKACFVNAFTPEVHMTGEFTFSKGCPGDTDGDSFLSQDDELLNELQISGNHFDAVAKIALYPLGTTDYMQAIIDVVNMAKDLEIYVESSHYCTIIQGDIHKLFDYFGKALMYCEETLSHYVLEVSINVNSPTK